jgi:hypothetical protein
MTQIQYQKKYDQLWNQALNLPRVKAILKLKECSDLKAKFFKNKKNNGFTD